MAKPTLQIVLDFAKHCVRPFHYETEVRQLSSLIAEKRLRLDDELSGAQLKQLIKEYHRCFHPSRDFTEAMADDFAKLVFEMNQTFGGYLTREALVVLKRDGLAPKKPRSLIIK